MQTKTTSKKKDTKAKKKKEAKRKQTTYATITIDHYVKEQLLLTYLFHEEFLKYENQLLHYLHFHHIYPKLKILTPFWQPAFFTLGLSGYI